MPRSEALGVRLTRLGFANRLRFQAGGRRWKRFLQKLRHGLRMVAQSPGFTTVAILTLALSIRSNGRGKLGLLS